MEVKDYRSVDENFVADSIVVEQNRAWLQFANIQQKFGEVISDTQLYTIYTYMYMYVYIQDALLRLSTQFLLFSTAFNVSIKTVQVTVKREQIYQKITNFGGAFTGSVSHLLKQLPQDLQDHVYK